MKGLGAALAQMPATNVNVEPMDLSSLADAIRQLKQEPQQPFDVAAFGDALAKLPAPQITVEAPQVTVQPAQVTVQPQITVPPPAAKEPLREVQFTKDDNGNVIGATLQ